jgi:membrane protein DedA with SNARE-associated domain
MQFWPLLLAGTIGTTAGNYAWFVVGDRIGYERLRPFVERHGRWLTLDWRSIERCSDFLRRHGQWVVFALRFSPVARTIISLPAGMAHMGVLRFLACTFAGAAIWNAILILGGHWLAGVMTDAGRWIVWVGVAMTMAALLVYAYRVATWKPRA